MDDGISVGHRALFEYYILYLITQYLDMPSLLALFQSCRPFRQSEVLQSVFRVTKSPRVNETTHAMRGCAKFISGNGVRE